MRFQWVKEVEALQRGPFLTLEAGLLSGSASGRSFSL